MNTTLVKVSVVVPVYNPGENIVGLIDSLAAQSLPTSEFEVIFVDDGSTDDTPLLLERACAQHPNMRVSTIPNSGWPGRPRNVGTDLATGEYVFYSDNDDEFFPESLERLYAMASANGSDIVYGKVVRTGRPTPYWTLWKRTIPVADPAGDRVVISRTVHKLFRRQFLVDHDIRFPEGKVRLEDFAFMAQAIPQARVISILADYPCYRWIHRTDGSNNSTSSVKQSTYWGYFTAALQTLAEQAGEGPLLDDARVVACEQAFSRFSPGSYLGRSPAGQQGVFDAVRDYVTAQVPATLDPRLPVLKRLRVQAFRSGDKDAFDALQRLRQELSMEFAVDQLSWQADGSLRVVATAQLRGSDAVALLKPGPAAGELMLAPSAALGTADADRLLRREDHGTFELTVRHRVSGLEWPVEGTSSLVPETSAAGVRLGVRVEATVDPQRGAFGRPLDDGIWDLMARGQFLGESTLVGLPAPGPRAGGTVGSGRREARAYVTRAGKVALQLSHPTVSGSGVSSQGSTGSGPPTVVAARWQDGALRIELNGPARSGLSVVARRRRGGEGPVVPVEGGVAVVSLEHVPVGSIADAYLRTESPAGVRDERLLVGGSVTLTQQAPYALSTAASGGLSVRRLRAGESAPAQTTTPATPSRSAAARRTRELPNAAGLLAMLPAPLQRVARGVRRRLKARR